MKTWHEHKPDVAFVLPSFDACKLVHAHAHAHALFAVNSGRTDGSTATQFVLPPGTKKGQVFHSDETVA
eukprot:531657-Prymnesium_polylepis.1